jgi:hypothetical protein
MVHPMQSNHRSRPNNRDQNDRINELKQQAATAAGGEMTAWESDTLSLDEREEFWRGLMVYETAPSSTHFQQLIEAGLELPDPDTTCDQELTSKLWEVIHAMARMRVFITGTDHLSDRELYTLLWRDVLREESPILPEYADAAWHIDVLGGWSETDTLLFLKYYADEDFRQQWQADFPDYRMPAHEHPPYNRDSHLPQWTLPVLNRTLNSPW